MRGTTSRFLHGSAPLTEPAAAHRPVFGVDGAALALGIPLLTAGLFVGCPAAAQPTGQWRDSARQLETSSHCRYLREHAQAEAAVLHWPELVLQGLRFPGAFGLEGTTFGEGIQARVGLAYSPSDLIKGLRLEDAAEARCAAERLRRSLQRDLETWAAHARLAALRAQGAYLAEQRERWQAIEERMARGLQARVVRRDEVSRIRRKVLSLEREQVRVRHQIRKLEMRVAERGDAAEARVIQQAMERYVEAEMDVEQARSSTRGLDAWRFRVTGGIIPTGNNIDWYSLAELRVSFGIFAQQAHLDHAEEARRTELKASARELPAQWEAVREEAGVWMSRSRDELALNARRRRLLRQELDALDELEPEASVQRRAALELERIEAESQRVFLQTLIERLRPFGEHP